MSQSFIFIFLSIQKHLWAYIWTIFNKVQKMKMWMLGILFIFGFTFQGNFCAWTLLPCLTLNFPEYESVSSVHSLSIPHVFDWQSKGHLAST